MTVQKKAFACFICWVVVVLSAVLLMVIAIIPAIAVSNVVIVLLASAILIASIAIRIFDPVFAKKHTTATGY